MYIYLYSCVTYVSMYCICSWHPVSNLSVSIIIATSLWLTIIILLYWKMQKICQPCCSRHLKWQGYRTLYQHSLLPGNEKEMHYPYVQHIFVTYDCRNFNFLPMVQNTEHLYCKFWLNIHILWLTYRWWYISVVLPVMHTLVVYYRNKTAPTPKSYTACLYRIYNILLVS